jgi:hypothetical protein
LNFAADGATRRLEGRAAYGTMDASFVVAVIVELIVLV